MPMGLLGLMYLSARHIENKEHRPNSIEWVSLGLISCFSLFMSALAIRGLITDISSRF